ncbi:multiple epidermal growth factor-like domains protein 11 [Saccostrea echinata]|uniref:multiple epidermal growth factor-like domains protein 11 n=1 Tax=Saccostrea echinata TaxID=191078 RepID=UPI002A820E6B|nr:multiple epidermal growth factor-like domains protein 11 [Saccostrea echinata]
MKTYDIGQSSTAKTVWWIVDLGGNHSIYSIIVVFKNYKEYEMRQRGRFAGFSLFLSNTPHKEDGHLCYKNSLPLPPLDFNTTCIGYGRYVIYYNERLDGVTYPEGYQIQNAYTELCEVKVQGCSESGLYGTNCTKTCPINCKRQRCNIINGTCLGCVPGYMGELCEKKCSWGWHGVDCKKECTGHCARNTSCNHQTGNCNEGCAGGWMGQLCDIQCKSGTYGPGCIHNCSGHCLNDAFCNEENGICELGCNAGYTGILSCSSGFFGNNCTCQDGHYGDNCTNVCPTNCTQTCNHKNGYCTEEKVKEESINKIHEKDGDYTEGNKFYNGIDTKKPVDKTYIFMTYLS